MSLGQKIKELRKKSSLSQEQLAVLLKVSRQSVSKYETDNAEPDIYTLKRISEIFEVSIDELLKNKEETEQPKEKEEHEIPSNTASKTYNPVFIKYVIGCSLLLIMFIMMFVMFMLPIYKTENIGLSLYDLLQTTFVDLSIARLTAVLDIIILSVETVTILIFLVLALAIKYKQDVAINIVVLSKLVAYFASFIVFSTTLYITSMSSSDSMGSSSLFSLYTKNYPVQLGAATYLLVILPIIETILTFMLIPSPKLKESHYVKYLGSGQNNFNYISLAVGIISIICTIRFTGPLFNLRGVDYTLWNEPSNLIADNETSYLIIGRIGTYMFYATILLSALLVFIPKNKIAAQVSICTLLALYTTSAVLFFFDMLKVINVVNRLNTSHYSASLSFGAILHFVVTSVVAILLISIQTITWFKEIKNSKN